MRKRDQIASAILLFGAGFVGIEAWGMVIWSAPGIPGPGFLPFLLAIGLAIGAVGVFLESSLGETGGDSKWFKDREAILRLAVLLCCIAGLVLAIKPLGMLLSVGLFLLIFLSIYVRGQWTAILFIAGGAPVFLYFIFERWLKVSLPRGFLGF